MEAPFPGCECTVTGSSGRGLWQATDAGGRQRPGVHEQRSVPMVATDSSFVAVHWVWQTVAACAYGNLWSRSRKVANAQPHLLQGVRRRHAAFVSPACQGRLRPTTTRNCLRPSIPVDWSLAVITHVARVQPTNTGEKDHVRFGHP